MKGFGSAYLWNLKRREEEIRQLELSLGDQQKLLMYEREVCEPCRTLRGKTSTFGGLYIPDECDVEALNLCFTNYIEKGGE